MSFARRSIISVAYHGVAAPSYQQCKVVVPVARREEQAEERRRKLRDEARRPFRRRARGQYRPEQGSWNFPFSYDFSYAYNRRISRSSPWRRISPGRVFRERERGLSSSPRRVCFKEISPTRWSWSPFIDFSQEVLIASAFTRHAKFLAAPSRVLPIDSHARPPTKSRSLARSLARDPIRSPLSFPRASSSTLFHRFFVCSFDLSPSPSRVMDRYPWRHARQSAAT